MDALRRTRAPILAISPIVAGAAVSGPAGILMAAKGLPISIAGVAQAYQDFLKILVVDTRDAKAAKQLQQPGLVVHAANTLMRTKDEKVQLARTVLSLLGASTAHAAEPS